MDLTKVNKILVVMLGGIGNVVLLMPSLRNLRQSSPQAQIVLLTGEPDVEGIMANEHLVDQVICLDRKSQHNVFKEWSVLKKIRQEKFDVLIMTRAMNPYLGGLFALCTGIKNTTGEKKGLGRIFYSHKVDYIHNEHEIDGTNRILSAINVKSEHSQPQIHLSTDEEEFIDKYLTKQNFTKNQCLVGFHVGSGSQQTFKRWDQEKFILLAREIIKKYDAKVILTGGPAEAEMVKKIALELGDECLNCTGLRIRQTAALVQRCSLFVSNDSGIAHISAAVGTPLIVLFGQTDVDRIAPRGSNVSIVRSKRNGKAENVNAITVEQILEEISKVMAHEKD